VKNTSFLVSLALLLIGSLSNAALAQVNQSEPYSFKDDQLGMSLEAFKSLHRNPGHLDRSLSQKPPFRPRNEWVPDMRCDEIVKGISRCHYETTVTGYPARVAAMFADGKLATIQIYLNGSPAQPLLDALVGKFGMPTSQQLPQVAQCGPRDQVFYWDNGVSMIQLQSPSSYSFEIDDLPQSGLRGLSGWSRDVFAALGHSYCVAGQSYSTVAVRLWYIHKSLAAVGETRRLEAQKEAERKLHSDI